MNKPLVRLGPLAILLLVVSVALTTLAILTFTTSRADGALADRYGRTQEIRSQLEREGNEFLWRLLQDKNALNEPEVSLSDGSYVYQSEQDGYILTIVINEEDVSRSECRIRKDWNYDDNIDNLWDGEQE